MTAQLNKATGTIKVGRAPPMKSFTFSPKVFVQHQHPDGQVVHFHICTVSTPEHLSTTRDYFMDNEEDCNEVGGHSTMYKGNALFTSPSIQSILERIREKLGGDLHVSSGDMSDEVLEIVHSTPIVLLFSLCGGNRDDEWMDCEEDDGKSFTSVRVPSMYVKLFTHESQEQEQGRDQSMANEEETLSNWWL